MNGRWDFLKEYLVRQWFLIKAWWLLENAPAERGGKDGMAAECLFRLNRHVKEISRNREKIYQLKNHLVRIFYQKGYCLRAVKAEQTLECWHTRRFLEGWDDYCPKCNNTGVYAKHELYHFTFLVGDITYHWHQPARLVDWDVRITGAPVVYEGHEPDFQGPADNSVILDQAILIVYLRRAGIKDLPPVRSLKDVIEHYWWISKHDLRSWWYRKMRGLERRFTGKQGRLAELVHRLADDGIPF